MIENSTEISDRIDFNLLCNARGLKLAVEVGTDRGIFACQFMERWEGLDLWCVDSYEPYEEMKYDRSGDMVMAINSLQKWHGRVRFVRAKSPDCVRNLPPWFKPQFVYIDASHLYGNVKADMEAWWSILPENGILAGHDYSDNHPGVKQAVDEFVRRNNLIVRLTSELSNPDHSWYIYKKEPEYLMNRFFMDGKKDNPHYKVEAK